MAWTATRPVRAAAGIYEALALAFHRPTEQLYQTSYLTALGEHLRAAGADELLPLIEEMAEGLRDISDLQDLIVVYSRLFLGPGRMAAPPYESVYAGGGLLMGESTRAVLRDYDEAGIQLWGGFRDMPDHIAAEMEFLHYLNWEEAQAHETGQEAEAIDWAVRFRRFLVEHPAVWMDAFADRVAAGSDSSFYRAAAALAARWVESEASRTR